MDEPRRRARQRTVRRLMRALVGLLLLGIMPAMGWPATMTIGPGGSLAAAVRQLRPGDTLSLRSGVYGGPALKSEIPSGADWTRPVTIMAAPGARPIIRPESGDGALWLYGYVAHHIIVDGLTLDASHTGSDAVAIGQGASHDIIFRNCEITGGRNGGGSGNGLFVSNEVHDVTISRCHVHHNGSDRLDHGFYLTGSRVVVEFSEIDHNAGYGVQVYHASAEQNTIRNNQIHHNLGDGGVALGGGAGNRLYNNLIYRNHGAGISQGYGGINAQIFNNTVYGHAGAGILVGNYGGTAVVRNNLRYQNGD